MRASVDLPEPESPMTTNTSPGQTWIETSRTATTQPVLARSSERESSASGVPMIRSARRPKIFQTPSALDERLTGAIDAVARPGRCGEHRLEGVRRAQVT